MTQSELNIIGLCVNILGTIILAFSLEKYIRSMRLAIDAHELFITSYLHPNNIVPIVQITGTDVHMNRGKKIASLFSLTGVILVILGFICQILAYMI